MDSTYYQTDENGVVHVDLRRGYHKITIRSPDMKNIHPNSMLKGEFILFLRRLGKFLIDE